MFLVPAALCFPVIRIPVKNKLSNVRRINRFRALELFSTSALTRVRGAVRRGEPPVSETVSKSQTIAQHVPYLRRYARALTGNQVLGDSYVTATLEELVREPQRLTESAQSKVELFRTFSSIWNSTKPSGMAEQAADMTPADRRLAK